MSLNIKNERVHALARTAAARTGRSQTSAIEEALRLYLAGLDEEGSGGRAEVDRLLAEFDARLTDADREALRTTDLYDENGLPA